MNMESLPSERLDGGYLKRKREAEMQASDRMEDPSGVAKWATWNGLTSDMLRILVKELKQSSCRSKSSNNQQAFRDAGVAFNINANNGRSAANRILMDLIPALASRGVKFPGDIVLETGDNLTNGKSGTAVSKKPNNSKKTKHAEGGS